MDQVAALIFMSLCIFVPMLLPYLDNITVVEKEVVKYKYIQKQTPKAIKQPKAVAPKIDSKMLDDCVQCLVSLGLKSKDAKRRAGELFEKKNYQSIEDFLLDVYKIG